MIDTWFVQQVEYNDGLSIRIPKDAEPMGEDVLIKLMYAAGIPKGEPERAVSEGNRLGMNHIVLTELRGDGLPTFTTISVVDRPIDQSNVLNFYADHPIIGPRIGLKPPTMQ